MRLHKKNIIKYTGKVYDLEVSTQDKTYNIDGIVVHNSIGGSLVSYALGITDVDPLKHNLLFERFLDLGRDKVNFIKLVD